MRIIVTGGSGAMALPAILYCLEQKEVKQIIIADIDSKNVSQRVLQLNDERVTGIVLDLLNVKSAVEAFKGATVVMNAASAATCVSATEAALAAGVNYIDLAGPEQDKQLALDSRFRDKDITGVLCMGTAPGMSNIMAAYAVNKMNKVESLELKDACVNMVPHEEHGRALHWAFAIETILNEYFKDATIMEDGKIKLVPAGSNPEIVNFKPPVGPCSVAVTAHSEVNMFIRSFKGKGLRNTSWKIGFEPEFDKKMRFLCALGFGNPTTKIEVDGQLVSPRSVLLTLLKNQPEETKKKPDFRGHMMLIAKGEDEDGQNVEYNITECPTLDLTTRMQEKGAVSSYRTGIYLGIATMMLARGYIKKKGVFYPHDCIPSELFIKEAVKTGIQVEVNKKITMQP